MKHAYGQQPLRLPSFSSGAMGPTKALRPEASMNMKSKNKLRRQALHVERKRAKDSVRRDERFRRRREEEKDPSLREARIATNIPATIDSKRTWDDMDGDEEGALGWAVDVARAKKRKEEQEQVEEGEGLLQKLKERDQQDDEADWDDEDSMLASSDSEDESNSDAEASKSKKKPQPPARAASPAASTATNMELTPEFLE